MKKQKFDKKIADTSFKDLFEISSVHWATQLQKYFKTFEPFSVCAQ